MSVVKSVLLFPFKLIGWLFQAFGFLIALVVVIYGAIFGYRSYQFWFAPTDTELGHNTTRYDLLVAINEARNKVDPECDPTLGIFANLINDAGKMPVIIIVGVRSGKIPLYDIPLLIAELPWTTADGLLWGFAESGYNPRAAGIARDAKCRLPKDFVKLPLNDTEYTRAYFVRAGLESDAMRPIHFK